MTMTSCALLQRGPGALRRRTLTGVVGNTRCRPHPLSQPTDFAMDGIKADREKVYLRGGWEKGETSFLSYIAKHSGTMIDLSILIIPLLPVFLSDDRNIESLMTRLELGYTHSTGTRSGRQGEGEDLDIWTFGRLGIWVSRSLGP